MTTGLPESRKTPGIYLGIILGGAGTSSGVAPKRTLLQGNAILSARAATLNALVAADRHRRGHDDGRRHADVLRVR